MPRNEKKTRLRGLPPKIHNQLKDSKAGSYPVRTGTDVSQNSTFDDKDTIVFGQYSDINYASKLRNGHESLVSEITSDIVAIGNVIKGVSDGIFVDVAGQETKAFEPFRDLDNPAAEAKGEANNDFFKVGTPVDVIGEGFESPLWSKHKIEIDISSKPCSFTMQLSTSVNVEKEKFLEYQSFTYGTSYPMAYYNFDKKEWEGIGVGFAPNDTGKVVGEVYVTISSLFEANFSNTGSLIYQTTGFTPGIINCSLNETIKSEYNDLYQKTIDSKIAQSTVEFAEAAGRPTTAYQFPLGAKYHATGSQTFKMKDVINRPFVVEKITVDIEGASYTVHDVVNSSADYDLSDQFAPASISNFFILNQRKDKNLLGDIAGDTIMENATISSAQSFHYGNVAELDPSGIKTVVTTSRDIVTTGRILGLAQGMPNSLQRAYKVINSFIKRSFEEDTEDGLMLLFLNALNLDELSSGDAAFYKRTKNPLDEIDTEFFTETVRPLDAWMKEVDQVIYTGSDITNNISGLGWADQIKLQLTPKIYGEYGGGIDPIGHMIFDILAIGSLGVGKNSLATQMLYMLNSNIGSYSKIHKQTILEATIDDVLILDDNDVIGNTWGVFMPYNSFYFGGSEGSPRQGVSEWVNRTLLPEPPMDKNLFVDYKRLCERIYPNIFSIKLDFPIIKPLEDPSEAAELLLINNLFYENLVVPRAFGPWLTSVNPVNDFQFEKETPYVLYPDDELIVGWQQPIPIETTDLTENLKNPNGDAFVPFSTMSFDGPAKIVLYGTYLSEGEESNDTLIQQLSSNTVHEIIGGR